MTKEEIREWEESSITLAFFDQVKLHRDDADAQVHNCLESQSGVTDAAIFNAAMVKLEEVLDIPRRMKEELDG
jgi:hypothetical protein